MAAISTYDEQTVETALHLMAANAGNSVTAFNLLQEAGTPVALSTLKYWKSDKYATRYAEIRAKNAPILEAKAIATNLELIDVYGALEHQAAALLQEKLPQMDSKDLANTVSKLAVAKGINTDKALLLSGRPTQVTEHRDTSDIMRALRSVAPGLVIDSTATEDTQPQALESRS